MRQAVFIVSGLILTALLVLHVLGTLYVPGFGEHRALQAGLADPVLNLNHFAALLAVGVWAGQLGDAARWALPGAFLGGMLLGLGLAVGQPLPPAFEPMIHILAVVPLALLAFAIVAVVRLPLREAASTIALMGGCHGTLHSAHGGALGSDLASAVMLWFTAGTLASAAALLALGVAVGLTSVQPR